MPMDEKHNVAVHLCWGLVTDPQRKRLDQHWKLFTYSSNGLGTLMCQVQFSIDIVGQSQRKIFCRALRRGCCKGVLCPDVIRASDLGTEMVLCSTFCRRSIARICICRAAIISRNGISKLIVRGRVG